MQNKVPLFLGWGKVKELFWLLLVIFSDFFPYPIKRVLQSAFSEATKPILAS